MMFKESCEVHLATFSFLATVVTSTTATEIADEYKVPEVELINNLHLVPVLQGHQSVLFGQQVPEIQGTNSILDNNTEQTF